MNINQWLYNIFKTTMEYLNKQTASTKHSVLAAEIKNYIDKNYCSDTLSDEISDTIFYDGYRATVSIGIAVAGKNIDSYKRIYKVADKAMQEQKENGRDGFSF